MLRHGDAEDGSPDSERRLTKKGERQSGLAGEALAALDAGIETCLTSPRVRALQTARIACEALDLEPEVEAALQGGRFDAPTLASGRGTVLLVGHEPDFSGVVQELTGARVAFKKGGLAAITDGELRLLLTPRAIAAIAEL